MSRLVVSEIEEGRIISEEYAGVLEADMEKEPVADKFLANAGVALIVVFSIAIVALILLF